jgi:hypothetical protein
MDLIILALVIGAVVYIVLRNRKRVPVDPSPPAPEDGKPYLGDKK